MLTCALLVWRARSEFTRLRVLSSRLFQPPSAGNHAAGNHAAGNQAAGNQAAGDHAAGNHGFAIGKLVRMHGLTSEKGMKWNGRYARVVPRKQQHTEGRIGVRMEGDNTIIACKPENLVIAGDQAAGNTPVATGRGGGGGGGGSSKKHKNNSGKASVATAVAATAVAAAAAAASKQSLASSSSAATRNASAAGAAVAVAGSGGSSGGGGGNEFHRKHAAARRTLLENIQLYVEPSTMMPTKRLRNLVGEWRELQSQDSVAALEGPIANISLLRDHRKKAPGMSCVVR